MTWPSSMLSPAPGVSAGPWPTPSESTRIRRRVRRSSACRSAGRADARSASRRRPRLGHGARLELLDLVGAHTQRDSITHRRDQAGGNGGLAAEEHAPAHDDTGDTARRRLELTPLTSPTPRPALSYTRASAAIAGSLTRSGA